MTDNLHAAAARGDLAAVDEWLSEGKDANARVTSLEHSLYFSELTPLMVASRAGAASVDVLRLLIQRGAWTLSSTCP
ncbi:MAG: hypothetical protein ACKVX7_09920 [Planctomycetota bacterium]